MSLLKQANHALRNGQYETAIRLYQQSLQDSPALAHIIQPNLKLAQSRHQKTGTAARQPSLPALPPKSSIDFAAMRVEDIISGAEQAMARDDWHSAYEHWNSLLTRPDEELSPQLLLRTSRELFKLDAFPQAAAALQRAATRNPQDPDVIREQAHQYYYHCYSSWLMLVTENEPDWYKADGLDKRPDWKTACELLEKAEKVSPRHNLRWYVQAYLLLAEDAWDKQNRTQAHAALDTALKAIGPNKLDQTLVQAIHTAVDQFRDGQVPENDPYYQTLQDQLKAMPLELLDVKNWLCLNDILNWNGLLLCGYVAREKAVDLALEQGKKENANKEALKTALKAALDRNDTKLADTYLGKLKRISPDAIDVRELDSCTELMKGNLDAFRQKWPHPPTPAEQRLRDYLKGKTVAVVGPAPTGTLDGEEIDRHDVVVRMNWRGQDSMPDAREFGSKTNISLYNAHTVRLLTADKRLEQTKSLDFRLIRRARHDANQLQMIAEYPGSFYKSLNAVPAILFNLLLHGAGQIKLFKVTFYLGKQHHAESYRGKIDDGFGGMPLRGVQPVMANHDISAQVKFCTQLADKNFRFDLNNASIHNKKIIDYISSITSKSINKNILVLSTGILSSIIAINICKSKGIRKIDFVIFTKEKDMGFIEANRKFLRQKAKDITNNIIFLNDFLNDDRVNDAEIRGKIGHEHSLMLSPSLNHWACRSLYKIYPDAKIILYEEGLGSYNSLNCFDSILDRVVEAHYICPLNMSPPAALSYKKIPVLNIDKKNLKLDFIEFGRDFKLKKSFENKVLIIGSSYSLYNMMKPEEELSSIINIAKKLIESNYIPVYKDHPRSNLNIPTVLKEIFGCKIEIIEEKYLPLELVFANARLELVVGSISSSLYYLNWLYDFECKTFEQNARIPFNSSEFVSKFKTDLVFDEYCENNLRPREVKKLPLVSVIVTAYNVEKYIEKCLISIAYQSYKNIEIIVVNDGSTDNTLEVINRVAKNIRSIKIINQKNHGVAYSRNRARKLSTGEYFAYVDGDDWVGQNYIESEIYIALKEGADIVRNSLFIAPEGRGVSRTTQIEDNNLQNKVLTCFDNDLILTDMPISPCAGIFKKNGIIENINFPENMKYEDISYYWEIVTKGVKIAYTNSPFYYYRKRPDSTTTNIGLNDIDVLKAYHIIFDKLTEKQLFDKFKISYFKSLERAVFSHMKRVKNTKYFEAFCAESNILYDKIGHFQIFRFDGMTAKQYHYLRQKRYGELKNII